ncbi:MAG TPA: hypothetical protein VMT62_13710 [Syntrophorhabdaceae bacterium]|nr:hypothetical protein [Syntrophorhabdaceae bacterium]
MSVKEYGTDLIVHDLSFESQLPQQKVFDAASHFTGEQEACLEYGSECQKK